MCGGDAQQLLQPGAVATGAFRLVFSAHKKLKLLVALAAGIFVKRHRKHSASMMFVVTRFSGASILACGPVFCEWSE